MDTLDHIQFLLTLNLVGWLISTAGWVAVVTYILYPQVKAARAAKAASVKPAATTTA